MSLEKYRTASKRFFGRKNYNNLSRSRRVEHDNALRLESLEPRVMLTVVAVADPFITMTEGQPLLLDASDSWSIGGTLTYEWDLNNDGVFETSAGSDDVIEVPWDNVQALSLPSNGVGTPITLKVTRTGLLGIQTYDTDIAQLAISNVAPQADAGGTYEIQEGQALFLNAGNSTDPDANDVLRYEWDLGNDGSFEINAGGDPFVMIPWADLEALGANNGSSLQIGLRVSDDDGGVSVAGSPAVVNIIDVAPFADAGGPYAVVEGESLTLAGFGYDPNGNDLDLTFAWDLNNDGIYAFVAAPDVTVNWNLLKSFGLAEDAPLTIGLKVTDAFGVASYDHALVLEVNHKPADPDAGGPYVIDEGDNLHLHGSAQDVDNLTYQWDLDGDGVFDDAAGKDPVVPWESLEQLVYGNPMSFWKFGDPLTNSTPVWVSMRVDDGQGGVNFDIAKLTIENKDPHADANPHVWETPYVIDEGQDLWLDASESFDHDANDNLTYTWKLDIGWNLKLLATSDEPVVKIPWQKLESYGVRGNDWPLTIKLFVSDGNGGTDCDATSLIVKNVAPTADAGGPYVIEEGQNLQLHGHGSDPNANDYWLRYDWDIDGDGHYDILNQKNPQVAWETLRDTYGLASDNRSLVMTLRVTDRDCASAEDRAFLLQITNESPAVNAGGPYTINEGSNLVLAGSGSDPGQDPLTFLWDLDNDGVFDDAAGAAPTVSWFTLQQLNLHTDGSTPNTIALMADDGQGGVNIDTATLIINNVAPTPNAGPDQIIKEGDQAILFGSFTDPYGDNDGPFSYAWNFGDGSPIVEQLNATHVFKDNGVYQVTLSVTDKDGGVGMDTAVVVVENVAPTVYAGDDKVAQEGQLVAFSGVVTDPGDDTFTYLWDFGDGNTAGALETVHTYADDGVYSVTLTVTDDDGGVGVDELTVYVQNAVPQVYAGKHVGIDEGDTVQFMGQFWDVNVDMTQNPTIAWDFGDGVTATGTLNPTHTYLEDGVYTARLTVTDKDGGSSFSQAAIIVSNVAPTVQADGDFLADFGPAGAEGLADAGTALAFHGSFTDPGILDTHTIMWNFGDGAIVTGTLHPTHQYETSGIYNVTLTVTDDDGGSTTESIRLAVQEKLAISRNSTYLHTINGLIQVFLIGPGELTEVNHIKGITADLNSIVLHDTTDASLLLVQTIGPRSSATVGDVSINSSLGGVIAFSTNLQGNLEAADGELGLVLLNSIAETAQVQTGLGGIDLLLVRNDIAGDVSAATSVGRVMSLSGGLTGTGSIVANNGDIEFGFFSGNVAGQLLASENVGSVFGIRGELSGVLRAGNNIGNVMFANVDNAIVSAGGNIAMVMSSKNIVDSTLLAGYDIGADGLPGTGDEYFNPNGATIGSVRAALTGNFDNTFAMAGVKPYDFTATSRNLLAPTPALQELASFGKIGQASVGQVFFDGDPNTGIYGLFAATEPISNVQFSTVAASGAPDFEARWQWL
ncbi:MAG: PKD domain-containing protein [Sedimentisphaerales bacterium]|nr:PKD domain-containing protein [Sedimentisphaerales bacterium]